MVLRWTLTRKLILKLYGDLIKDLEYEYKENMCGRLENLNPNLFSVAMDGITTAI